MKSKIKYRCAYVVGVLAASTIVTCSISEQVVSANEGAAASHYRVQDPHMEKRSITRTICYRRPDNGQKIVIKQTVGYQIGDGQTVPVTMTLWPEYYLPYFKGYCPEKVAIPAQAVGPNDQSMTIEIEYRPEKYRSAMEQQKLVTYFDFYDAAGKLIAERKDAQPYYQLAAFPQPPAGYEYVNPEQIPAQYQVYFANSDSHKLLVQPIQHHPSKTESKQLTRQICCHLPNGQQIIKQPLTLTRQVTVTSPQFNKQIVTPWLVTATKKVELPQVKGYLRPALPALPSEISDESQLEQPLNLYYQPDERPLDEEVQVDMKADQQDSQTQTDEVARMQDQATMTENISRDAATSTADLEKTGEVGVQTEDSVTDTVATGTDDLIEATQKDTLGVDAAIGDSEVNVKDQASQVTIQNQAQAESTQTEQVKADKECGDNYISIETQSEAETKTVSTDTHDLAPVQTDQQQTEDRVIMTDQASQTIDSGVHQETQTLTPPLADQASGDDTAINYPNDSTNQAAGLVSADHDRLHPERPSSTKTFVNPNRGSTVQVTNLPKQATVPNLRQRLLSLHNSLKEVENRQFNGTHTPRLPQTGNQTDDQLTLIGLLLVSGVALLNLYWLKRIFNKDK